MIPRLKEVLLNPSILGTVMYAIANHLWKDEDFHSWDPDAFDHEFYDLINARVPQQNLDRLNAVLAGITTDRFYKDWQAFTYIAKTLSGAYDPLDMSDHLMVAEACWATTEIMLNDDDKPSWSPEVKKYVGLILEEDGLKIAPRQLQWATLPEVYEGSSYPADMMQATTESHQHLIVAERYVEEQSFLLFKQLRALPWMTSELLKQITEA